MKLTRKSFLKYSGLYLLSTSLNLNAKEDSKKEVNVKDFGAKGDGQTDDTLAFQKALKENNACFIPPGKYLLKELILSEQKLYGHGQILMSPSAKFAIGLKSNTIIEGLEFISKSIYKNTISDLKILENAKHVLIKNNRFTSSTYSAISADINGKDDTSLTYKNSAQDIKILENFFTGNYSRHIYLHSVNDLIISHNSFSDSNFDSIRLRQRVENSIISHNIFKNIGTLKSKDSQDAIDTYWSGNKLTISHNLIEGCSKHGLDIKGHNPNGDYGSEKIIISHNQIRNSQHCGISLSAGAALKNNIIKPLKNIIIENNIIEANNQSKTPGNAGIQLRQGIQDSQITKNQIYGNLGRGIFAFNPIERAPQLKNLIISQNIVKNNGFKKDAHGIILSSVENLVCTENICENEKAGNEQQIGLAIIHDTKRGFKKTTGIIKDNILNGHKMNRI